MRFLVLVLALMAWADLAWAEERLSFNGDVRPVLAGNCYDCHGPDEESRKAKLRLDDPESAAEVLGNGEFVARIRENDPDEVMPPPKSHKKLSPEEIELLARWAEEGASYERHWAFERPVRPEVPKAGKGWARNAIDAFVLERLEKEGLKPSEEADRYALVRRVYLDLIGVPPTVEEADAFVADESPEAYEKLVEGLLADSRYGERWARQWLDLARYADTNGYEKDRPRSIWPYRDWVIEALNADMPFDQFSIEQLAGDMLPGATRAQRVATGFHRNTMVNEEGGIDPNEFRFYAMVDRVATTGTVWMGLTTGCAQCHTHKYDPITHTDYYGLMALLNNADEPDLLVPSEEVAKERVEVAREIAAVEEAAMAKVEGKEFRKWLEEERAKAVAWTRVRPSKAEGELPLLTIRKDDSIFVSGDITKREVYKITLPLGDFPEGVTAIRLEALPDPTLPAQGPGLGFYEGRRGDFFLSRVTAKAGGQEVKFSDASHSYGKISVGSGKALATNVLDENDSSGWSTAEREGEEHRLVLNLAEPLRAKEVEIELLHERHFAASLGRFAFSVTTDEKKAVAFPSGSPDPMTATASQMKRRYVREAKGFEEARKAIAALERKKPNVPSTLVMRERPARNPRVTHRHHRGEYLKAEEVVEPAVPAILPQLPEGEKANRLTFARWLVSEENPLVGRVTVNRAWLAFFGRGLASSAEDFGTQADAPTHPELLDWLAVEFMEGGWSMKELHRLIVTSATYRQDSRVDAALLKKDPGNELYARGPRFRMEGERVRDAALAASGLLSAKLGGPSVYPPQPASVAAAAYGNTKWPVSKGEDRYRRSLYTHSKRTAPFAAFLTFDGPSGENCVAERGRSNTPLQALTLLNDAMYLELAEGLAELAVTNVLPSSRLPVEERARFVFRRCLVREPSEEELGALVAYFGEQLERFEKGELNAEEFVGEKDVVLAAWTLVARAVMNLDEFVVKG